MKTLSYLLGVTSYTALSSALPQGVPIPPISDPIPPAGPLASRVRFAGTNIAGFDFGCGIDGTCDTTKAFDVAGKSNGIQQMQHFVKDDGLNAFRLPVSWQFLVNNKLGAPLDATNLATYDQLVQGCVTSGAAMCIIDIHNYARWNNMIIAQTPGGPTNEQLASLWSQLATKYKDQPQVAFDIMNEPHDIPDLKAWGHSSQVAVTAIRNAGAKQTILLPGTNFASAELFISSGSADVLSRVTNPGGGIDGLVYNVHKYLDADNSGTNAECAKNNIDTAFKPLAAYLRTNQRMAMLTETGGGPNAQSCMAMLCQQNDFINANADVYLGVVSWAAGGFDQNYVITQTPKMVGTSFLDQPLVTMCTVNKFRGVKGWA
ncbi:cellulase-domain-containing protein [Tothia fuscella]|uniref:Endoglucanase EG-II n=1 Tax=Tothia fuscella TaxID=1048955 RepID=A0A9P4TVJ3_9PEZI|nr:cellulase-domain-containing protein [Tothia fuscella]